MRNELKKRRCSEANFMQVYRLDNIEQVTDSQIKDFIARMEAAKHDSVIRSRVQMPNYVKESIRSLVKSICDKDVDVSIALHKESKTDQQRKYFWTLVKELRSVMKNGQTENDVYLHLLRIYGTSDFISLPSDQVHLARACYRIVEVQNKKEFVNKENECITVCTLRCWKGLSEYDTNEACMLIDGAVEECKSLGIPTDTPDEIRKMKELWGIEL